MYIIDSILFLENSNIDRQTDKQTKKKWIAKIEEKQKLIKLIVMMMMINNDGNK